MKNKPQKKPRKPILLEGELIPVTDPVEFAELDRRCRAAEKAMAKRQHEPEKIKAVRRSDVAK